MSDTRTSFSDYIIFADESGDHGLKSINPENPIFALAFCIFKKSDYISIVKPAIAKLKIDFWGHDLAILHNHAIRKSTGDFRFLFDEEKRLLFLHALNEMIKSLPFWIAATVIDKRQLQILPYSNNPYDLALESCLEQACDFLAAHGQSPFTTHLLVESRGPPEDKDLLATFQRLSLKNFPGSYPLEIRFVTKQANSSGLQIADLVAHPIARHQPGRSSRAFEIIENRLLGYPEYQEIGIRRRPQ